MEKFCAAWHRRILQYYRKPIGTCSPHPRLVIVACSTAQGSGTVFHSRSTADLLPGYGWTKVLFDTEPTAHSD
ncbi:hypothetical protein DQP55_17045 [Mycolicibacterium sp. GF69]|nr:hypothetical protein DQP55_17045 [Mycolicibacterium sp. GF69]